MNNGAGSTDFLFDPQGRLVSPSAPRTVDVDVVLNVSGQADITVRAQSGYAQ